MELLSTNSVNGTAAIDLTGNAQANKLYGNAGNNFLDGGFGSDTITGYGGADSFVFRDALDASNIDTITDFSVAADTIRLENAIFNAIVGIGTLTAAGPTPTRASRPTAPTALSTRPTRASCFTTATAMLSAARCNSDYLHPGLPSPMPIPW